jgi:L-2-hydroxyglutarate oxidase LhgO
VTETVDSVVIGAGVVGLAVARALALSGRETIVLEAADAIGTGTSSRNSEIIHAGIYYPKGSLKARLCVRGKEMMYDYCASHGVEHKRCGKLIVATNDAQLEIIHDIKDKAEANGVMDLKWLNAAECVEMEPALNAVGAYLSPSTGLIDSHGLMLAYQGDLEDAGGMIAFNSPLAGGEVSDKGITLEVGGEAGMTLQCQTLVNSAGLEAQSVASKIEGVPADSIPPRYLAKGNYFTLSGKSPFSRPIYPVPEKAGLGVHLTVDLGGQAKFGPDVEWVEKIDYEVDPSRGDKFYAAIRDYWPGLEDGALQPGYAGMRPKLQAPGEVAADFVIQDSSIHGVKGLINLYGIESPGLTSSLAIAEEVLKRFEDATDH